MSIVFDVPLKSDEIKDLLAITLNNKYEALKKAKLSIAVLFVANSKKTQCLVDGGMLCAATIKITPLKYRVLGVSDMVLFIDQIVWEQLNDDQREALIVQQLHRVQLLKEKKTGALRHDDNGRPCVKIRPWDFMFGGFNHLLKDYKQNSIEAIYFNAQCKDDKGQQLFNFNDIDRAPQQIFTKTAEPTGPRPANQKAGVAKPARKRTTRTKKTKTA